MGSYICPRNLSSTWTKKQAARHQYCTGTSTHILCLNLFRRDINPESSSSENRLRLGQKPGVSNRQGMRGCHTLKLQLNIQANNPNHNAVISKEQSIKWWNWVLFGYFPEVKSSFPKWRIGQEIYSFTTFLRRLDPKSKGSTESHWHCDDC